MSAELFIALRYLKAKRKGLFSMMTSVIGVAGVAIGVAALIITLSIMNGFQSDIKKKIMDAQAHIIIYGQIKSEQKEYYLKRIKLEEGISQVAPFALGQAILTFRNRSTGIIVKGIDEKKEFKINNLKKSLVFGKWENFTNKNPQDKAEPIVLGEELAKNIGAWLSDEVILVSPQSVATSVGIFPKMKKFRVTGLIRTGYYEFDSQTAYIPIKQASGFFGLREGINGMGVKLLNIDDAGKVASVLRKDLGISFVVKTYADMNRTLFSALKLEKFMMSLILALIILVATFNIASNLLLMSIEKLRDIGIMRAIGAKASFVRKVFLWEGNLIALSGIMAGLVLGLAVSLFIAKYPIIELPADIYYITKVPVKLKFFDILATLSASYVLCMLSALYPAIKASKVSPVDAIRYG